MLGYGRRWLFAWHPKGGVPRRPRLHDHVVGYRYLVKIGPLAVLLCAVDAEFRERVKARVNHERRIFGP